MHFVSEDLIMLSVILLFKLVDDLQNIKRSVCLQNYTDDAKFSAMQKQNYFSICT